MPTYKKDVIDLIKSLDIEKEHWKSFEDELETENLLDDKVDNDDGFIEVRDHHLFVFNRNNNGKQPILIPNSKLSITVNGLVLKKEQVVFVNDYIQWSPLPKTEYEIIVSKDNLNVYLKVHPELFLQYQLKDRKRATRFILDVEVIERELDINETVSEIVENIVKRGINVKINTTAIMQELLDPTHNEILVAEGLPVIPAKDGYIEQYFSSIIEEVLNEVDGTVDFKNRLKIPTVEAGEIIAQIISHQEGKSGFNVFGEQLNPKSPKEIVVRPKPRVKITDDGKVIALFSGRPSLTGQSVKQFDILETYEINKDIDMSTGNIFFNGDIIIRGNVKDGMRVDSSGNIYIYGNVYKSIITAAQNITIFGNVINSKVNGGQFGLYYSTIYRISQDLSLLINRLWDALKQMKVVMTSKKIEFKLGYVLATLVETKFKEITKQVNEFRTIIQKMITNNYNLPLHFQIVMNSLTKFKDYQSLLSVESEQSMQSVIFAINELIQKMEADILEESDISFYTANYSQIKTNGKIYITKEGVINTTLFSGTDIIFKNKDSVIRGGKIEAVKTLTTGIVGTEKGKSPIIYAGEKISIEKVYQAHVKMKDRSVIIDEEINHLELIYNEKNEQIDSNKRLKR